MRAKTTCPNADTLPSVSRPFWGKDVFLQNTDRIHLHREFLMAPVRIKQPRNIWYPFPCIAWEKSSHVNKANLKGWPSEPVTSYNT